MAFNRGPKTARQIAAAKRNLAKARAARRRSGSKRGRKVMKYTAIAAGTGAALYSAGKVGDARAAHHRTGKSTAHMFVRQRAMAHANRKALKKGRKYYKNKVRQNSRVRARRSMARRKASKRY